MKLKILFIVFTLCASFSGVAQEDASVILNYTLEKAKKENKNVFIKYGASWCTWCKKMDAKIKNDAIKASFEKNYVFLDFTVMESKENKKLETPGAIDLLKKHSGIEKVGLPFWVILNSKGEKIADAYNEKGQNLGCPVTPEEVASFISKLKISSSMSPEELSIVHGTFVSK